MKGFIILSKVIFICDIPFCYANLIYIYISQKQLYLDDRFYVAQSTTCLERYIGHFQGHTIPQVHIKEVMYKCYFLLKLREIRMKWNIKSCIQYNTILPL